MALTSRPYHSDSKVMGEAEIEVNDGFNLVEILLAELHGQRLDIALEVLDFTTAHDGKHVGRLVHDVGKRDAGDDAALALGDAFEHFGELELRVGSGPNLAAFGGLALLRGFEVAAAEGAPGAEAHALGPAHGDDVALEVAVGGGPVSLVGYERAQAVGSGVFVSFGDDPRWGY
jgi:hypothetical protein